jgi:hypothetical protein
VFFHLANAVENFTAIRQFEFGQFRQNFHFTHGGNLSLLLLVGKRQADGSIHFIPASRSFQIL